MPTIRFDYTSNINIDSKLDRFLHKIHGLLVQTIKTDIDTCRTLINKYDTFLVGNGNSKYNAFVQLEANILPGRSHKIKNELGNTLLKEIKLLCEEDNVNIDFRVIIRETDTQFYFGL